MCTGNNDGWVQRSEKESGHFLKNKNYRVGAIVVCSNPKSIYKLYGTNRHFQQSSCESKYEDI